MKLFILPYLLLYVSAAADLNDTANDVSILPATPAPTLPGPVKGPCLSTFEFRCHSSGRCIPNLWLCDGARDCSDGEDESIELCHVHNHTACAGNQPECITHDGTHRCILHEWLCDGHPDCADGTDERGCETDVPDLPSSFIEPISLDALPSTNACSPDEFKCNIGSCIPRGQVCDDHKDCPDGSDESKERCSTPRRIIEPIVEDSDNADNSTVIDRNDPTNGIDDESDIKDEEPSLTSTTGYGTLASTEVGVNGEKEFSQADKEGYKSGTPTTELKTTTDPSQFHHNFDNKQDSAFQPVIAPDEGTIHESGSEAVHPDQTSPIEDGNQRPPDPFPIDITQYEIPDADETIYHDEVSEGSVQGDQSLGTGTGAESIDPSNQDNSQAIHAQHVADTDGHYVAYKPIDPFGSVGPAEQGYNDKGAMHKEHGAHSGDKTIPSVSDNNQSFSDKDLSSSIDRTLSAMTNEIDQKKNTKETTIKSPVPTVIPSDLESSQHPVPAKTHSKEEVPLSSILSHLSNETASMLKGVNATKSQAVNVWKTFQNKSEVRALSSYSNLPGIYLKLSPYEEQDKNTESISNLTAKEEDKRSLRRRRKRRSPVRFRMIPYSPYNGLAEKNIGEYRWKKEVDKNEEPNNASEPALKDNEENSTMPSKMKGDLSTKQQTTDKTETTTPAPIVPINVEPISADEMIPIIPENAFEIDVIPTTTDPKSNPSPKPKSVSAGTEAKVEGTERLYLEKTGIESVVRDEKPPAKTVPMKIQKSSYKDDGEGSFD